MRGYEEVSRKVYSYFALWARDNVEGIHSESVTVADKVVVKNKDEEVIAYVYLGKEMSYYIRKDYYESFTTLNEFRDIPRIHKLEDGEIFTISINEFMIILKYDNRVFRKMVEEVDEQLIDGEVVTSIYYKATDETFTIDEVNKMVKDAYKEDEK